MPRYTALVTLLAILFYFYFSLQVASAHGKFGVKLPATFGDPDFERIFPVQMNTLEWMPIFLPLLCLCAVYLSDIGAAIVGLVWLVARVLYFLGYREAVDKRLPGFVLHAVACRV